MARFIELPGNGCIHRGQLVPFMVLEEVRKAAALLTVVTVLASLVPSMRAANVNPIDSLRTE